MFDLEAALADLEAANKKVIDDYQAYRANREQLIDQWAREYKKARESELSYHAILYGPHDWPFETAWVDWSQSWPHGVSCHEFSTGGRSKAIPREFIGEELDRPSSP